MLWWVEDAIGIAMGVGAIFIGLGFAGVGTIVLTDAVQGLLQ